MNTPSQTTPSLLSPNNIFIGLFRRKWLVLLGIILGMGAAAAVYISSPAFYVSEAKLLVRYIVDTEIDPAAGGGRVMRPDGGGANMLNSEVEILASRDLAQAVVEDVGAGVIFPAPERKQPISDGRAAVELLRSLQIEVPHHSNIIRLRFQSRDPEIAQKVLDRWVKRYLEKHQEIHSAAASYGYFSQKTDHLRADLRQTEAELLSLKNEQGVVSVSYAKQALLERQNELRRAYQEWEKEIAGAQARIAMIESQIGAAPPAGNEQEAEAPSTPDAAQREIQLPTRDTPDSAPRNGTQIQHAEAYRRVLRLKEEVASAEAQQRVLRLQEDEAVETIAKLNVSESKIVPLERQRAIQDDALRRFSEALDAAKNQLTKAPDQLTNIAVVEPATMPMIASNEDVMKKAMLAGVIGLGICGGLALLLELIGAIRA